MWIGAKTFYSQITYSTVIQHRVKKLSVGLGLVDAYQTRGYL